MEFKTECQTTVSLTNGEINFIKGCILTSHVIPNGLRTLLRTIKHDQCIRNSHSIDSYNFQKLYQELQPCLDKKLTQGMSYLLNAREDFFQYLTENSLSDTELATVKQKISDGFVELNLSLDYMNNIIKTSSFSEDKVLATYEQLSQEIRKFCSLGSMCYHPVVHRSNKIAVVLRELEVLSQKNPTGNCTIFIDGNHGCGKSVLAKQAAKCLYEKNKKNLNSMAIVLLNAETEETLLFSYVKLAKEILCNFSHVELTITSNGLTIGERIRLLKLITGKQLKRYSSWVVVIDNIKQYEQHSNYWPAPGSEEWGNGNIIVTLPDVKNIEASVLDMAGHVTVSRGMEPFEVIELLSTVSSVAIKEEAAVKMAEVLEYNPLALTCAAMYVSSLSAPFDDCPWKTYLKLFNEFKETNHYQVSKENLSGTNLLATQMLARQVLSQNPDIPDITYLVSLFHPFSVRKETVSHCMESISSTSLEGSLKDLSPFVLVTKRQASKESFSLLYQLQDIFSFENGTRKLSILASGMTTLVHQLSKLENPRTLVKNNSYCLSHGVSLLATKVRNLSDDQHKELVDFLDEHSATDSDAVDILVRIAEQCHMIQKPEEAIALLQIAQHVLEDKQVNNPEIPLERYLNVLHHLGCVYKDMGYADARNYLEKVLRLYQEQKEVPHKRVADVLEALGDVCVASNDTSTATLFYTKSLETKNNPAYPNQPLGIALSRYKLGNVLALERSFQAAKENYEKALESLDMENKSNAVSLTIVKVLTCAGAMSVCVGEYELAKKYLERAMRLEERLFSKFHPCRLSSIKNAANACAALKDYETAESLLRESVEISQRVIGRLDTGVAQVYSELGALRTAQEDWKSAIDYHNNALEIQESIVLCQVDRDIANICCDLGYAYANVGELEKAKYFHERSLGIRGLLFKGNHPDIGKSYFRLGKVYNELGDNQTGLSLLQRAVEIRGNFFGLRNPETLESIYHLGQSFAQLGQFSNAKELLETVAEGQQEIQECKLDLAKTSASLAEVNLALGKTNIAKQHLSRAIDLQRSETGQDHPDVARPMVRLALVHEHCQEMGQAKRLLEMALRIYKKGVGQLGVNSQVLVTEIHLKRVISKLTHKRCTIM